MKKNTADEILTETMREITRQLENGEVGLNDAYLLVRRANQKFDEGKKVDAEKAKEK